MRIFKTFGQAVNEIRRDLAELSVKVHPETWQGRAVAQDEDYATREVCNYSYTVTQPLTSLSELQIDAEWALLEFQERVSPVPQNPGQAWRSRPEVWGEFVEDQGQFDYTYSERMCDQLPLLIRAIDHWPQSRQLFLSIWDRTYDPTGIGVSRVPCSLGYLFQLRQGRLNMTYLQRSCDFVTHFQNDVYLAVRLLVYVCDRTHKAPGSFTHWLGSLHVLEKDVAGVF